MEECELLALSKEVLNILHTFIFQDLYKVDVEFPEVLSEIVENAQLRYRRTMKLKEKALEFLAKKKRSKGFSSVKNLKILT